MPIFEYRCDACGHPFEELVRGSAKVHCPSCDGTRLTKQFSVPARPMAKAAAPAACDAGLPQSSCCGGGCHTH